jgi:hypothetical protein
MPDAIAFGSVFCAARACAAGTQSNNQRLDQVAFVNHDQYL